MATPAIVPGRVIDIEGVACRAIFATEVPKRFWRELERVQGTGNPSLCVVSIRRSDGSYKFIDYPPSHYIDRGSMYMSNLTDEFPDYHPASSVVLVPVSYLDPEINAFGVVSP